MFDNVKSYFANFDGATNSCRTIALWVAIALIVGFVATKLYIAVLGKKSVKYDETALAAATKIVNGAWIIFAVIVAIAFIATFAGCYFADVAAGEDVLVPILFYPLLVAAVAVVASAITLFLKPTKLCKIICAAVCGAALIAVIVCMIVYYSSGDAVENNGGDVVSNLGLYLSAILVTAAIIVFAFLSDRHSKPLDTRTITFAAVCVALSFALSYVRLFKMPMGGSITLASMLPLMLFAFMFGPRKGILVGFVYGLLQAVQEPYIIHPAQFLLDYAVAFAALGLTGCLRTLGVLKGNMRAQFAVGACIACGGRFLCHFFAGAFAFGMYGASYIEYGAMFANIYFYSFVYQCLYLLPELAIVLAAGMLIMSSKNFRKQINLHSRACEINNDKAADGAATASDTIADTKNSEITDPDVKKVDA